MTLEAPEQPTVLCIEVTSGPFLALVLPVALCPLVLVADLVATIEGFGRDVSLQYVWR